MKNLKTVFVSVLASLLFLSSCDSILEPTDDDHSTTERLSNDPAFAEGLLMTAYLQVPTNDERREAYTEMATDDAVSNNRANTFLRVGTGEWTSLYTNNFLTVWDRCIRGILYANKFKELIDVVPWKWSTPIVDAEFRYRFKGETFAVRGILKFHLLTTVGGYDAGDRLLGFPDYNRLTGSESETDADFNIPRMTFAESVQSIYNDLDSAVKYLPMDYADISSTADIPAHLNMFGAGASDYNLVYGINFSQRISGRIAKAYKAKTALLAASPAFNPTNDRNLWATAATLSGELLKDHGGAGGVYPEGHKWFTASFADAITKTHAHERGEMIWRRPKAAANTLEVDNYPPLQYGQGLVNPTQNLVDAFPMANGYPISHPSSGYRPDNPYQNRDSRLDLSIVYDGSRINGVDIYTGVGGRENAKDSVSTSTRTGYYLKKTLRDDMNISPQSNQTKNHYLVNMRYTELYLIYAEAANEAWGPDGDNGFGFSARDVIGAIRKRAGTGLENDNAYLQSVSSLEDMRSLIRNERRLELCFEGFRFWDLRRWKADLTETAKGVNINADRTNYTVTDVERRVYDNSYMHYGPVPYNEILKYDQLVQNKGW
ncbi:MAG: RagB/SusD family nutrient uptake outer membrane protein [Tannerella sp.]|jgi:hypothetical protein|nr:RagB/SusD family nutrient uptake outer membrane protein [Tannerella sp.]